MPFHQLTVVPEDVTAAGLGLALNAPSPQPLARCRISHPDGGALVLGVLGASHVITVEHPNSRFSEEISCTAHGRGGALPDCVEASGYHLDTSTDAHDEASFRTLAEHLRERCARDPGWLGGTFGGDDAALTALAAEPDGTGWRWQTWHLYPAHTGGTVVYTASRWHP